MLKKKGVIQLKNRLNNYRPICKVEKYHESAVFTIF